MGNVENKLAGCCRSGWGGVLLGVRSRGICGVAGMVGSSPVSGAVVPLPAAVSKAWANEGPSLRDGACDRIKEEPPSWVSSSFARWEGYEERRKGPEVSSSKVLVPESEEVDGAEEVAESEEVAGSRGAILTRLAERP